MPELRRDLDRVLRARDIVSVGKISGAVGTFAHLDPEIERRVCEKLGLEPAVSSQVIQRDRACGASVALDDLRGHGGRFQAEPLADARPRSRDRGARTCRPRLKSFPRDTMSRARSARSRSRRSSTYQSASFRPKVIGSAWTRWVRPIIGVGRCSSRTLPNRFQQGGEGPHDQVAGLPHLERLRGVEARRTRSGRNAAIARQARRARRPRS